MDLLDGMRIRAERLRSEGETDRAADLEEYADQLNTLFNHPPMASASVTLKEVLWELSEYSRKAHDAA